MVLTAGTCMLMSATVHMQINAMGDMQETLKPGGGGGVRRGGRPADRVGGLFLGGVFGDHVGYKAVGPSLRIRLVQSIRLHHCHLCMHQHTVSPSTWFLGCNRMQP